MKKVLFVISTLEGGGAERVLSNIVTHFPDGWHIDILLNNEFCIQYPYKGNILSLNLPKSGKKKSVIYLMREIIRKSVYLRKIKRGNGYEACISFLPSSNISNVLSGNKYCKTIVSIHRNVIGTRFSFTNRIAVAFFFRVLYMYANKIIAVSEEITLGLREYLKLPQGKIDTIVNGYDCKWIRQQISVFSENENNNNNFMNKGKLIITIGRMVEQKGQWHLIRAFSEVVKYEPNARLWIIGDGILKKYLTELVNIYDLEKEIIFTGYINNPFWYLAHADIFILPSLFEGYPNVLVEAICCGIPCIATDVHSGVREILAPELSVLGKRTDSILEEEYGILIPVCSGQKYQNKAPLELSERKMAEAMIMLLGNGEKQSYYKQKSIERSRDLDIGGIVNKWMNVILE